MAKYDDMVAILSGSISKLNKRNKNSLWLKDLLANNKADSSDLIDMAIMPVMQGLQQKSSLADVACTIGNKIRSKFNFQRDSLCALFGGLVILESFAEVDFLDTKRTFTRGKKRQKHPPYHIFIKDYGVYQEFLEETDIDLVDEAPFKEPVENWQSGYSSDRLKTLIRNGNLEALNSLNEEKHSLIFNALNKLQNTGYTINKNVFEVFLKCSKLESGSPFKYEKELNQEAKRSMRIEVDAIKELATKNISNTFYHRYTCDFRGRIYPETAYLNEQSSDNAKGLIIYDHGVELGDEGEYFLAVHTANSIGNDKVPLDDRVFFVQFKMSDIISWAENPMVNTEWMQADKPWSTLACAFEWKKLHDWEQKGNTRNTFKSVLPIFIDGSNNGVQHLTALALDEKVAPLVNLDITKENAVPGDIYMEIADKVWEKLVKADAEINESDKAEMNRLIKEVSVIKTKYEAAMQDRKKRDNVYKELVDWRKENRELIRKLWSTFWLREAQTAVKRKTCKRPVMTLAYGVTRAGAREQVFDDTKSLSEELRHKEKSWVTPMGDLIFDTCYSELPGPAAMLELFRSLAEDANKKGEFLSWTVPSTNFPVVQAYETPTKVQVNAMFQGQRLQLTIQKYENKKLSKKDQVSGAAPNIIHSFDAAHLTMVVNAANYPVTMVHDSFGCHAGNMPSLFKIVRQQFVEFYIKDPLVKLLEELNTLEKLPKRGKLDLYDIMLSDFAFC